MNDQPASLLEIVKRQFDPSFEMLYQLVIQCPDELWRMEQAGAPYWQQVYHTTYFIDFWLREEYSQAEFRSLIFTKDLSFELGQPSNDWLTRDELKEYLGKIREKLGRFFGNLEDEKLSSSIVAGSGFTYLDAIAAQIRHIQYHVGQCNTILGMQGLEAVGWIAYNENG
jgi:hypothetical protein